MNKMTSIEIPPPTADIARAVFSMFVFVADVEKDITAQEVRRFQTLLKEVAWIENDDLRGAVDELRQNYSSFWALYEDGKMPVTRLSITETLMRTESILGMDRSRKLRHDLNKFLQKLEGGVYGVKLVQGEHKARSQARLELARILRVGAEAAGAPAPAPGKALVEHLPEAKAVDVRPVQASAPPPVRDIDQTGKAVWQAGKTKVRCVSVIQETHDAKTYNFEADPKTLFHYSPGQFVTIEIPMPGQTLRRSYTISSSPSRPYMLSITVKKVPMGWMSNWLFDNMTVGYECQITGPSGKFSYVNHPAEKVLFLAAGSGITPCISMLRWLADTPSSNDIVFINNVRTPNDIIFHQELMYLSTRFGSRLRLAIVPSSHAPGRPWAGHVGSFDEALLRSYAPDFMEREIFTCGPPGYMQAAKGLLSSKGFPMNHCHDESFGGGLPVTPNKPAAPSLEKMAVNPPPAILPNMPVPAMRPNVKLEVNSAIVPAAGPKIELPTPEEAVLSPPNSSKLAKVKIQSTGDSFSVQPGQTILEAAEESGIMLDYSCRSGACGTCKMKAVSGRADMTDASALSGEEISSGHVLTCVGRIKDDIVLVS